MRPDRFSSRDARVDRSNCDGPVSVSPPVTRWYLYIITFRVRRRRREMYCGQARLCVCLSVRGHMPTLLHGPGCKLGEWLGMPSSCALLGGFQIGARVALLWQHSANAKC